MSLGDRSAIRAFFVQVATLGGDIDMGWKETGKTWPSIPLGVVRPMIKLAFSSFLAGLAVLAGVSPCGAHTYQRTVLKCDPRAMPGQPLGRFAFHMKKLEVGDDDGFGDKTIEFRFHPYVRVYAKKSKADWSLKGPIVCRFEDADVDDWPERLPVVSSLLGGKRVYTVSLLFVLEDVPRERWWISG